VEIEMTTLAWLAGLLEGEGSFGIREGKHPIISLQMKDEDTVAKVAVIFGRKYQRVYSKRYQENGWSPIFVANLTGKRAVELMTLIRPFMGQRRQEQIDRSMAVYKDYSPYALTPERLEALKQRLATGENVVKLAKEFGVSKSYAYYVRAGRY
jgi:hypothetical protein